MASVSDTEDGWATLYEISASSDDESSEEGLEQSTSDLQSRVDALLEKMDLLQLQIRLKNGSIQSLTGRLEVLETVDRKVAQLQPDVFAMQDAFQDTEIQNKVCKSSINVLADIVKSVEDNAKRLEQGNPDRIGIEGEIAEVHSRFDAAQIDKKGLQSQIRLNKGSVRSLERRLNALETNRVDALEASVERVERENHELFEREYDRISAAESDVRALGEATYDRYSQAIDRVTCLEANVERLEQDAKDRIDGGLAVAEFQSKVEAIEDDRKLLQSQIRLNKGSMVSLAGRVKGLESSVEHHREEKNRVDSLESDMEDLIQVTLQRVKRENKARSPRRSRPDPEDH
uniref:Fibronectin type III and SPRY domain-containing protein 1 n=1 Tax=Talaromyces marneffei PM1 TaxID=1077442 RepID=A0A093VE05_TALMA